MRLTTLSGNFVNFIEFFVNLMGMKSPALHTGQSMVVMAEATRLPQRFLFNLVAPEAQDYSAATLSGSSTRAQVFPLRSSRTQVFRTFGTLIEASRHPLCLIALILALTACSSTPPVVVTEIVHQPTYLPVPATLTAPTIAALPPGTTWGQAVGTLYNGLQSCNADKSAIATLKPPAPP